ncbi:non-ribosomal peptide synthetase [Nonomuraea angiospora]|uniref:non-ribosomal peptide synthetase n=1 Tax=Nonomuraea angiospora TaxID=46172 RepID=UPI0033F7B56E
MLSATESPDTLRTWGEGIDGPLHRLVETQAARTPHRTAITVGEDHLTYAELDSRADSLARVLVARGGRAETPVAVVTERSVESFVALLAVLKAGGVYVPVDPAYPEERIRFLVTDADAPLLLTQGRLLSSMPRGRADVIVIDDPVGFPAESAHDDARPGGDVHPDQLAYVIYTSGSTGLPKGVMTTHQGATASTVARKSVYPEDPGRFLMLSSMAFDSSIAGTFWTLACGGHLLVPATATQSDPELLARYIARHRPTHLLCVPSLYQLLVRSGREVLSGLRLCVLAGEEWPPDLHERHRRTLPETLLSNEYGATEVSVWSTGWICPQGRLETPPQLGDPIPGSTMYVLDENLRPVGPGERGEAYLGGVGVARGYLGKPGVTAASFVPDPFAGLPGTRMYRTGDVVERLPGGGTRFVERVDDQAKIRGYRVELSEVRARLCALPEIADAAAVVAAGGRLVAYVVFEPGTANRSGAEVRRRLAEHVPPYMVPQIVVELAELPLTPNGKVDRRALPPPREESATGAYEEPATPHEWIVARAFAEVLGVRRVGRHANFIESGGDSLGAMSVASTMRLDGLPVTAQTVLTSESVAELALAAAGHRTDQQASRRDSST